MVSIAEPLDDLMRTLTMLGPRHMPLTPAQFDTLERVIRSCAWNAASVCRGNLSGRSSARGGALQDLMSVVRAHSALHEDAHAGSALHLVQVDASLDEEVLEPSTFEIVEPAAAIPDDVEAVAQEPAPQEDRHRGARRRRRRDIYRAQGRREKRYGHRGEVSPSLNRKQNNPPPRGCVTSSMPNCWKYF